MSLFILRYLFPELKKKLYSIVTDVTESFVIMQYNKIKNDKARVIKADTGRTNKRITVLHWFYFIIVPRKTQNASFSKTIAFIMDGSFC